MGGSNWRSADFEVLWKTVTKECKAILVGEGGMRRETFAYYIGAARKCLVFEVPFQFAVKVAITELRRVKEIKDADKSDAAPEMKLRNAVRQAREEKIKLLPMPIQNPHINELRALLSNRVVTEKVESDPKMLRAVKTLVGKLQVLKEELPAGV